MSRLFIRHVANFGKLVRNVRNVPAKSELLTSCNLKFAPSMMHSFGRTYASPAESLLKSHLESEIGLEKQTFDAPSKRVGEFEVKSLNGSEVELFRTFNSEKITIKFNIVGSLVPLEDTEGEEPKESEEGFGYGFPVSRPSFSVNINKGTENSLVIRVDYLHSEDITEDGKSYDISSFSVAKNGEIQENTYTCFGENMDEGVYEHLFNMLEERGVNQTFVDSLEEWSTNYDKKLYIELLESLTKHVK